MVDKGGTEETQRADHEVRRRREKRKEYERLLEEHPAVKAMRAQITPRAPAPLKPGVPKLVAEAMQDKDAATAVTAMRRVMKYHHDVSDIARRRLRRERVTLNEQKALLRQGKNVELDFREALRSAAKAIRANPLIEAYTDAITVVTHDTEVLDNFPSYLSQSELAAIKYLGVEPQEVREVWDQVYIPRRQEIWELLASGKINERMERIEEFADQIEFQEAPRYLIEKGLITIGGNGSVRGALDIGMSIIAVATIVVAGVVAVACTAVVSAVLIPVVLCIGMGLLVAAVVLYKLYQGDEDDFNKWYTDEEAEIYDQYGNLKESSWIGTLPDCPYSLKMGPDNTPLPHRDPRFKQAEVGPSTHPGAEWQLRSESAITDTASAQQCCYQGEYGEMKLITSLGVTAGSPDKGAIKWPLPWAHFKDDLRPYDMALALDGLDYHSPLDELNKGTHVLKYLKVRPANQGGYSLSVEVKEGAGSVTRCVTSKMGKVVTMSFYPADGWKLEHLEVNGVIAGTSLELQITMDSDKSVTAYFEYIPMTLTLAKNLSGGYTDPKPGTYQYEHDELATITAHSTNGYRFDHWEVNSAVISSSQFRFVMNSNKSVLASFKREPGLIVSGTPAPTLSTARAPSPTAVVAPMAEAAPTVQPAPESYIANRSSMEVHRSDCFWVTQMKDSNKIPCSSLGEVSELIRISKFNGCFYCLPRYDMDKLSKEQVLTNLEEDFSG